MLAIKSVPMPTTCGNCMFGRSLMDTFGNAYCAIFPTLPTQVGVRPDWCPLEDVPQRMRGRWKPFGRSGIFFDCSECGWACSYQFKFCPNCGADMRGT